MGATLHRGARASHRRGLSCRGSQAPDAQAQQLWHTGLAAPRHVGSSQTRARTRVPCIGRQTLNHCATREALNFFKNLFIYFWLCWVFVSVQGLVLVAASGGHSSSRCVGLSLLRPLLLWSTGSRRAGSVVVAHGPTRSAACRILPDQGSNPCPPHWQADSQPLRHQGSPILSFFFGHAAMACGILVPRPGVEPGPWQ